MKGRVIVITPDGFIRETPVKAHVKYETIKTGLDGGDLEIIPHFNRYDGQQCVVFGDEEAKLKNLPFNKIATELWHTILGFPAKDYLAGPIIVIVGDEELLSSL
jgi:hypothetical protein